MVLHGRLNSLTCRSASGPRADSQAPSRAMAGSAAIFGVSAPPAIGHAVMPDPAAFPARWWAHRSPVPQRMSPFPLRPRALAATRSPSARGYADVPLLRLFPAGRAALVREGEPQRAEAAQCAASGAAHRPAEASHLAVVLDALQT